MITKKIKPNFKIRTLQKKTNYVKFVFEPLSQGYGHTVGNALRRCLLNSLPGAAVTHLKIEGVSHQFTTLPGLKEDIVELILNIKKIRIDYKGAKEIKITLDCKGPRKIKAGDIKTPPEAKIVNKDFHLASLADHRSKINIKMWVNTGYGYSPSEDRKISTLGVISIDAIFAPIVRVNYKVEATRVGRRTDFDKLMMEVWTDGTIKPREALDESAKRLESFFTQIYSPVFEKEKKIKKTIENSEVLKLTVEELNLPTRIANSLRRGGYGTVKQLTRAKKEDIVKVKNLGGKSVDTIIEKLAEKGVKIT